MIEPSLILHLNDDMLYHILLIIIQLKLCDYALITFGNLTCRKSYRNSCCPRMILDKMYYRMNTAVYRTSMVILITEILPHRAFPEMSHMYGMRDQFIHTLIPCRGYRHDRHTEHVFHAVYIDGTAVLPYFIHHI